MLKTINKVTYACPRIFDMGGWLLPNMYINSQMMISSDPAGNFCMESFRFLPES